MIVIENLKKSYQKRLKNGKKGKIVAVDGINLEIKKGEIFGIIGPNGAGKTTFLKIMSTLIFPDEGNITIDGYDIVKDSKIIKNKVSLLAGEFVRTLYWRLSGRQNMKFFASLRSVKNANERIEELIELFDMNEYVDEFVMKYSTGMKHKLAIAIGLLSDPPVLFLDEPLTGIDPVTSLEIKKIIRNNFKEKTIIWTSHNLYEIEEMCHRIALLNKGKIVLQGSPEDIKRDYWGYHIIKIKVDNAEAFKSLEDSKIKGNTVEINTKNPNETLKTVVKFAEKEKIKIEEIVTVKPTLEEIFLKGIKNV